MGPLPNANAEYLKNGVAFWNEIMQHGTWDAFWEARDILPHLKNIRPAVMVVGGWFDTENLFGALHTYEAIKEQNPGARDTLVMGPWFHGEWSRSDGQVLGDIDFGSKTADYYTELVEVPFFNYYQTDPLKSSVTVAGPIAASVFVSTSGTDSDWVVKVIDVFPDNTPDPTPNPRNVRLGGYEMLVRGDVLRGKFRNSMSTPQPFVPNQPAKIEFVLQDVFHAFKEGHRIMVQVQSTWFPMIDLNPQKFVNIYHAQASDFQKATERIYSTPQYPSHIGFGLMRKSSSEK
jgi:predicted acyl esterase